VRADGQDKIGHVDTILLSNSTWINETDPCVVYGMRGVVYANLAITSKSIDAHSGVDGGMVREPMGDMVRLLGAMSGGNGNGVDIPGFCEYRRPCILDTAAGANNGIRKRLH
jgi:di- and tripeptidase